MYILFSILLSVFVFCFFIICIVFCIYLVFKRRQSSLRVEPSWERNIPTFETSRERRNPTSETRDTLYLCQICSGIARERVSRVETWSGNVQERTSRVEFVWESLGSEHPSGTLAETAQGRAFRPSGTSPLEGDPQGTIGETVGGDSL